MDIFRALEEIPPPPAPRAVAVGNFDGLHLGHRRLLDRLKKAAAAGSVRSCVLTFSPHPEKIFGRARLSMIQTLEQRLEGLAGFGIDEAMVLPFSRAFARLPGSAFIEDVLVAGLRARAVVVGVDFRFGRGRAAGVSDLKRRARADGFIVRAVPHVKKCGRIVRSSRIRDLLLGGRVREAGLLLGRPYEIDGDVVAGDGRGRRIGFPTANVLSPNEILPGGVFITRLDWEGGSYPSVTSIGSRPTFGRSGVAVETFVLDFDRDLYGSRVRVALLEKLRNQRKFPSVEPLRARIAEDVSAARAYFRRRPHL